MPFETGTLILVDYTAKIKDTENVIDTTFEEIAKKHPIHVEQKLYGPKLIAVGESWVLGGLDKALAETSVGDKKTIEVLPKDGFGERDPKKVRMIPLRKLGEDAEKVSIGDTVEIDNKVGTIRFIGSGRVSIDYNHRHAGKTILYEIDVKQQVDNDKEKIAELLKKHTGETGATVTFQLEEEEEEESGVKIAIPESIFQMEGLGIIKRFIQMDIFKFTNLTKVTYTETFTKPVEPVKKS